jgi:hypothetical protein
VANGVLQSGSITPGHVAGWVASGVINDIGPLGAMQKVLTSIRGANFNATTDQALILPQSIAAFKLTEIIITNASASLTTAEGGFYTGLLKTGTTVVAATQTYSTLTTANILMDATLASGINTTRWSNANLTITSLTGGLPGLTLYFSLTTPQGLAATADIYLIGIDLT